MKWKISYLLLMLYCLVTLPACAGLRYSAEPMEAKIVDADTKQPLEGVIVVAHWQLERGTVGGSVPAGQLVVMETATDKDGKFSFPGFGPKLAVSSHLVHKDPELILFKSGYRYRVLTNQYSSDIELRTRRVRKSEWSGRTIEMKQIMGNGRHTYLGWNFQVALGFLMESDAWKQTPCALLALDAEAKNAGLKSILDFFPVPHPGRQDEINKLLTRTRPCRKPQL